MRKLLLLVAVVALLAVSGSFHPNLRLTAASPFLTVSGSVLSYQGQTVVLRGENFNNEPALACCGGPNINAINASAADYNKVSSWGGNVIRFGLDYQWYSSNKSNFYQVVDQQVAWAAAAHLWMIPVMYMPPGGSSGGFGGQGGFWGSQANQDALTAFWADFAAHYANNPTIAGYDIFNEPAPPSTAAWDTFAQTTYNAIAAVDPNHFVALEESSANWDLPSVSGPRILWSSHCYGVIGTNGCNFPGSNPSAPSKRPFWVGEFGSQYSNLGPVAGDISGFNSLGVSWTHFVMHEGGFGLYQTYGAGDFSSPWQAMIDIVSAGMAGSVKPGAVPSPSLSVSSTPSAAPTPTISPSPSPSPSPSVSPSPAPSPSPTGGIVVTQSAPSGFVTRTGTKLLLNGRPYQFAGLNIYNANSRNNCWYTMGTGPGLDSSLTAIPGQNVFRAWFYQQEATLNGVRDWAAFDHTLAVAKAHGERVIATLADQWGACESGGYKNESWYQSGYASTVAVGTTQPYRAWVAAVVSRYRNDPTVMAWQLMNEAEDLTVPGGPCSLTADATLKSWAADMAAVVKGKDANHLLSLGTIGSGQCGGLDYAGLHSVSGIDLCEYHDYGAPDSPMPGDQWHGLQAQLNRCAALNKPLFVGETGIASVGGLGTRASDFQAKFTAQFTAGVVGELIWDWRSGSEGGSSLTDFQVGPGDPVLALLQPGCR